MVIVDCSFQLANSNQDAVNAACDNIFPDEVQFHNPLCALFGVLG